MNQPRTDIRTSLLCWLAGLACLLVLTALIASRHSYAATVSDSVGIEGKVPAEPPLNAPTITFPKDGAAINKLPVTVTGLCQSGLTVRVFKNNIFGGAAPCVNGNYSIQIDLFSGKNILVARQYDDLDQASPPSNRVTVTFPFSPFAVANRISLTSSFAKRGAAPGDVLTWPIVLSGGVGPYAITINWGDGTQSDIISREFPGEFLIEHIYESAGTYNILIRAADKNKELAFLQIVGVGTGEISQSEEEGGIKEIREIIRVLWWPAAITVPMILIAYWLGRRSAVSDLRKKLDQK